MASASARPRPAAVLFDLDGTLLDTAPDFVLAINALRAEEGLPPLALADVRAQVSHGSPALIVAAFGHDDDRARSERRRLRLLSLYASILATATTLFPGMSEVLDVFAERELPWGIVTNKPAAFTLPLLAVLGLDQRVGCVISGDSTARTKPFPDPLLAAATALGVLAAACLYVGDAERDIAAARAAGMRALVALYGYLAEHDQPHAWGGDGALDCPLDLMAWI